MIRNASVTKKLIVLCLIAQPVVANSQSVTKLDSLQKIIIALEKKKAMLISEQNKIDEQLSSVKDQMQFLAEQQSYKDGRLWVKCKGGWIISKPSIEGDMIVQVPTGQSVSLATDYYSNGYVKASYLGYHGFIYEAVLQDSPELEALLSRLSKKSLSSSPENRLYNSENRPRATTKGASRAYHTGPRGGCYYISSSGKKVYVDRSLCN